MSCRHILLMGTVWTQFYKVLKMPLFEKQLFVVHLKNVYEKFLGKHLSCVFKHLQDYRLPCFKDNTSATVVFFLELLESLFYGTTGNQVSLKHVLSYLLYISEIFCQTFPKNKSGNSFTCAIEYTASGTLHSCTSPKMVDRTLHES